MDASLRSRAEQLAGEIAGQARTAEDLNGLMRLMMKSALERMLNTEMDVHLGRKGLTVDAGEVPAEPPTSTEPSSPAASSAKRSNRRNGRSRKTVQGDLGEVTIATPRDRNGTFEPQLIGKHQRRLPGFDEKIKLLTDSIAFVV
jgi:putative transposase